MSCQLILQNEAPCKGCLWPYNQGPASVGKAIEADQIGRSIIFLVILQSFHFKEGTKLLGLFYVDFFIREYFCDIFLKIILLKNMKVKYFIIKIEI
jgi:hypothetical protein